MKTTDIEVGEEYAQQHSKWTIARRVRVLETGVERQEGSSFYGRNTKRNGVRVEVLSGPKKGEEQVYPSREFTSTWAAHEERERRAEEVREGRRREKQNQINANVTTARRIDRVLEAGNFPETDSGTFFNNESVEVRALVKAGFMVVSDDDRHVVFTSRLGRDLNNLVTKGEVSMRLVQVLLGDAEELHEDREEALR